MENFDKKIRDKLNTFDYEEEPSESSMKSFFDDLDEVASENSKVKKLEPQSKKSILSNLAFRIAASFLILLIGTYTVYQLNTVSVYAENGSNETVILPDNSKVILNADSRLSYNKIIWNFSRQLEMEGEAFFEVTKGEKFEVHSSLGITKVLGTSFNIFARNSSYVVDCYTGKVSVSSLKTAKTVVLTPGKGVKMQEQGKADSYNFDLKRKKHWRQGAFYFENSNLSNVIKELARQYNVDVYLPLKYQDIQYTGFFDNKDLNKALKMICDPAGLDYKIKGNDVVIK